MSSYIASGTLVPGTPTVINVLTAAGFRPTSLTVCNDHATGTITLAIDSADSSLILPGDAFTVAGLGYAQTVSLTSAAACTWRLSATSHPTQKPEIDRAEIVTVDAGTDGITIHTNGGGDLELMDDAINNARIAKIADDTFTTAQFVAGGGGKFAAGCLDTTALTNVLAVGAFTAAHFAAGAKFAADCLVTAGISNLFANSSFTSAHFSGASIKFAAGALNNAGLASFVADDAFTATEVSAAGPGGKFNLGCITTAGISHLFAADSFTTAAINDVFNNSCFTTAHFSGAEIKFAAGALDSAGATSFIAAKAIPASKLEDGGAASGIEVTDIHYYADTAPAGTVVAIVPPVVFGITCDNAATDIDVTLPAGPSVRVVDLEFIYTGTGAAGDKWTLKTAGGVATIAEIASGSGTANAVLRATTLVPANAKLLTGATVRVTRTNGGSDCSGVLYVKCLPVA